MPSTRRWSVPPKRIAATAVLGVIGIFLVCGSVGMGAWLVGALGIAVIAVGTGIFVLSALNSRATSEIEGTAHVLSASAPPSGVTHGRCRLNLVVYGKGINGVGVKIRDATVPVAKWPDAGSELPVMISIDKPQRTRVLWGDVATHRESAEGRARAWEAEERAAAMAAEDNEYADLNVAFDNPEVDEVADASLSEPPLAESSGDEPPLTEPSVGDSLGSESAAGDPSIAESYQSGGEPAMAASGTRTIEMDVMDPSLMRWTGPPPRRPHGSRPSPYRRRRSERADTTGVGSDEPPPDAIDATPPAEAGPAPAEAAVAHVDNDMPSEVPGPAPAPAGSVLVIDNGQIVGFDLLESPSAVSPTGATSRSAPPEWPPRSAAAAAAAAALPHQWDDDDLDDHAIPDEAAEAASTTGDTTGDTIDSTDDRDFGSAGRRVPRIRAAPADELFDQDAGEGPGYNPDTAYADDAGYDPDAGYNSDAGNAGPAQPSTSS